MTGIEALVRLPMLQHQRDQQRGLNTAAFVSGLSRLAPRRRGPGVLEGPALAGAHNVHFQPGVNEELAATAVWGSQQTNLFAGARYDGVYAMWYGKGPGVDRSMDVLKHANAFGTSRYGGVLAVAGDDHACKSSTLPHQSEHNFIAASIPVLSPGECPGGAGSRHLWLGAVALLRLLGRPEGDHGEHGFGDLRAHRSGAHPDRVPRGLRAARLAACTRAGPTSPWSRKSASTSTRSTRRGSSPASTV
jgi:hypothetical protein